MSITFAPNACESLDTAAATIRALVATALEAPPRSAVRLAAKASALTVVEALIKAMESGTAAVNGGGKGPVTPYYSDSTVEALDNLAEALSVGGPFKSVSYWLSEALH